MLDGKWTLERLLGEGGMAAVYAARHRNGARAAIKILHPDLARHAEIRERFQREGYAANQVEHPGAVKVLDDGVISEGPDRGTAYIVMELLEGESLQDRLERGPAVGEIEFLRIAQSVLEVLDAAHSRGVVHRDLKPENLFLAKDSQPGAPQVKILDFGLARLLQNQAITSYGLALGTPSFMSPEQAAGRIDEIDGRTDLFAIAATGFRLRAGKRIHEGDSPVELVTKMANLPAPTIASIAPDVSEPFARVIDRALAFRREDRYETAAAMLRDVRRAIAQLDAGVGSTELAVVSSQPPTRRNHAQRAKEPSAETIELSDSDLQAMEEVEEESIHIPRRRVWPWLALVAILLAGAAGGKIWLAARGARASMTPAPASSPSSMLAQSPAPTPGIESHDAAVAAQVEVSTAAPRAPLPSSSPAGAASNTTPKPPMAPVAAPAPVATHRRAPAKVGPAGIVHKLPKKHYAKKTQ